MCKHKFHSCSENVLQGFYNTFYTALPLKLAANNIFYIANPKKLVQNLTSIKSNKDNLMFAIFWAFMNSSYKLVLCFLRRILKNDKLVAPIAGFLAGIFSILDAKKRRQLGAVLLLSRAFDS